MKTSSRIIFILLACQWPGPAAHAQQPYPSRPVRMLIPSPPGGATDMLGRLLQSGMEDSLGQPVVVDNRGGANGQIAAAAVAKASPDGHTLLFTYSGVLTTGMALYGKLPYDPIRDFAPVAMVAHVPGVLVSHPSFAARSVSEIIKMAKARPGALTHGTSSIGSSSHMNMALFKQMAGIDMLQVTYQGDAPALAALVGGQVQLAFSNVVAALPHLQSGRLRAVAVTTLNRTPSLADTPSIAESGLPGYESLLFYCMVAPSKLPASVVERLNVLLTQIKQTPGAQQRLAGMGAVPFDMPLAAMKPFLEAEIAKWTRVVKAAGITPE